MSGEVAELVRDANAMPDRWLEVTLSDVADVNPETLRASTPPDFAFGYIDISQIDGPDQCAGWTEQTFGDAPSRARRKVQAEDILVSTVRPYLRSFAQVPRADIPLVASTGFAVIRGRHNVDQQFLYQHILHSSFIDHLTPRMTGSNYPAVSAGDVGAYPILLPPLDEQRRIAEVLRSVDEAIACSRRVLSQLSAAKTASQREAFSAVATATLIPDLAKQGWWRTPLGKVFRERKEKGAAGLPVASVSIELGLVDRTDLDRRVASNLPAEGHSLVRTNDIAYNMMRMWQGASGVASADCLVSPAYVVMTPTTDIDPRFAHHMLRSDSVIRLLHAYSQGIVDDRLRLYPQAFCQIPVNLPPLAVQREIAELLDVYGCCEATVAEELACKEAMKATLTADLLSGRVRVPA